jgi:S1-C subfamily serine protease
MWSFRQSRETTTRRELRAGVSTIVALFAIVAPLSVAAQAPQSGDAPSDMSKLLGLSVAASGGPRDTLGLLIASVTRDGPADQAGITTGSRILAVNGLQVRLAPSDIGRRAAADSAVLRFDRALRVTPPGRDVMLRVAGGGRTRLISLPLGDTRGAAANTAVQSAAIAGTNSGATATRDTSSVRPVVTAPMNATVPDVPPTKAVPAAASVAVASVPVASIPASSPLPTTPATTVTPTSTPTTPASRAPRSVSSLADALGDVQLDLRRMARESHSISLSDSLADIDAALGALRRRIRFLGAEPQSGVAPADSAPTKAAAVTPTAAVPTVPAESTPVRTVPVVSTPAVSAPAPSPTVPASATPSATSSSTTQRIVVQGLELAKVSAELASYLGPQADSAWSVVRATDAWEPMHVGDVIVQVDGRTPDAERVRAALESHRSVSVTLLRRGRSFTVLLGDAAAR